MWNFPLFWFCVYDCSSLTNKHSSRPHSAPAEGPRIDWGRAHEHDKVDEYPWDKQKLSLITPSDDGLPPCECSDSDAAQLLLGNIANRCVPTNLFSGVHEEQFESCLWCLGRCSWRIWSVSMNHVTAVSPAPHCLSLTDHLQLMYLSCFLFRLCCLAWPARSEPEPLPRSPGANPCTWHFLYYSWRSCSL